jgi:hypothetical protein
MRRSLATVSAVAILAIARPAQADEAYGVFLFSLFGLSILVPSEIGTDRTFAGAPDPRLRFGWAYQFPLGAFAPGQSDEAWVREEHPLWRHRIVVSVSPALAWSAPSAREGHAPGPGLEATTIDFQAGYRYRFRHRRGIAPYLGLGIGAGAEPRSHARAVDADSGYVAPEAGLHFGRDQAGFPGLQLGLEGLAFWSQEPARVVGTASWTLW